MKNKLLIAATVVLLLLSSVSVMAANSPVAPTYHNITISTTVGGTITASSDKVESGKEVTLTSTPDNGKQLGSWVITGTYTIVTGDLTSGSITIIPSSDLTVGATFTDVEVPTEEEETEEEETEEEETTVKKDPSSTSPQTGIPVAGVLVTLLASGCVAVATKKRA